MSLMSLVTKLSLCGQSCAHTPELMLWFVGCVEGSNRSHSSTKGGEGGCVCAVTDRGLLRMVVAYVRAPALLNIASAHITEKKRVLEVKQRTRSVEYDTGYVRLLVLKCICCLYRSLAWKSGCM